MAEKDFDLMAKHLNSTAEKDFGLIARHLNSTAAKNPKQFKKAALVPN